jgi:DNA-binding beta-propeller fold protein YncE
MFLQPFTSQNFSVSAQETTPTGIAFNTDGTKMFIVGYSGHDVNEYDLSTGFDLSTAVYSQNFSVASQETEPQGVAFNKRN